MTVGNLLGARRRASNSGSRGGGSKEWRQELGWSKLKNLRDSCSLRSAKVGIFATSSAEVYGTSIVRENIIRSARFWIASILSA